MEVKVVFEGIEFGTSERTTKMHSGHFYKIWDGKARQMIGVKGEREVILFDKGGFVTYLEDDDPDGWLSKQGYIVGGDVTRELTILFWKGDDMRVVRVWGFPTSGGGVDFLLYWDDDRQYIQATGVDDMGNHVDDTCSVEQFLDDVKEQSDYEEIKKRVIEKRAM